MAQLGDAYQHQQQPAQECAILVAW
jgi:hypothetical protein